MRSRLAELSFPLVAAAIIFQITCPIVIARQGANLSVGQYTSQSDAARYRSIATAKGTPYQDFAVEYPPVAVGLFHAIGPRTFDGFRKRLFALQVACQALIIFLLFRVWGSRAAKSYLCLSAPMLFVIYNGYDLVGVALAVAGAAFIRSRRPLPGALTLVVGAFTKIWPVVLLPGLLAARKPRAFVASAAAGALGLVAWTAWGGTGAIGQVLGYRGAHGWEYESIPGSVLRLVTGDALRFERGAWRLGSPPHVVSLLLTVVLVALVAAIWWGASRRPELPDGVAETAAIAAVLVTGSLLSLQFLIWPLPFVAIAAAAGVKRLEGWAGAVAVLTLYAWILFDPHHPADGWSEVVIIARNAALVGLLVTAVLALRPLPANRRQEVGSRTTG